MKTEYKIIESNDETVTFSKSQGEFIVICDPWQGEKYCESKHSTESAAIKAADKYSDEFRRKNGSGAYGHSWKAAKRVK